MPVLRLPRLRAPIHVPPAPHDPLDGGGCAGAPHSQQSGFGLRCGHTGQGADLGVGQLPTGQGLGEERECPQGAGHSDPFTCGA